MNILVIDKMPLFCDGITYAMRDADPANTVYYATSLDQAWPLANHGYPAIFLLAFDLIQKSLISSLQEIGCKLPGVPTMLMVSEQAEPKAFAALSLGAVGILPKTVNAKTLCQAISQVLNGNIYLPRTLLESCKFEQGASTAIDLHNLKEKLTPRQFEVMQLLAQGKSNKEICRSLGAAEGTVKNHLRAIFRILGVRNRTEAAIYLN